MRRRSEVSSFEVKLKFEVEVKFRSEVSEVYGVTFPSSDGRAGPDDTFFNVGLKYDLTDNVAFLGSAGRSFHDRDRGTFDLLTFVGFQMTWGGNNSSDE